MRILFRVVFSVLIFAVLAALPARSQSLGEALDSDLVWVTSDNFPWQVQTTNTHDGIDAVCSGIITSNQTSWIETSVMGPATIRFWTRPIYGNSWSFRISPGMPLVVQMICTLPLSVPGVPYSEWIELVYDVPAGPQEVRWTTALHYGGAPSGSLVLDQFRVEPPRELAFTKQPSDQRVYAGEAVAFSASVIGTPPFQYQWRTNGVAIPDATNSWISLITSTTLDSALYSVAVTNSQGSIVSTQAQLTVQAPVDPPSFTTEPANVTAYEGETITLTAGVTGSPPFSFEWLKDGETVRVTGPGWSSTADYLTLADLSAASAGNYSVVVTNSLGRVESGNAFVKVLPSIALVIMREPRSLEVADGTWTWLSADVMARPEPIYIWKRVGDGPPPPSYPPMPLPGYQNPTNRNFSPISPTNAGVYFLQVSNGAGTAVSREVLVTILPPLTNKASCLVSAEDLFITNGLAFLAQGSLGLGILNISDPAAPVMVGGYDSPGYASVVQVSGDLAFVIDGPEGLQVLNVSNPSAPSLVANYKPQRRLTDVRVRGSLVFLGTETGGAEILDISDPAHPVVIGSYPATVGRGSRVCLAGDYLLVSSPWPETTPGTNTGGLLILDVSNPSQPVEAGRAINRFSALDAQGTLVFGMAGGALQILNIANPAQPFLLGEINSSGFGYYSDIRVVNDRAYLGWHSSTNSRISVSDVSDPAHPVPVGYYSGTGQSTSASTIWVQGQDVFLCGTDNALKLIGTPFANQQSAPPRLQINCQDGLKLQVSGRAGMHYEVQWTDTLVNPAWSPVKSILLTNETQMTDILPPAYARFFRVRQDD